MLLGLLRKPRVYFVRVVCPHCDRQGGLQVLEAFLKQGHAEGALKRAEHLVSYRLCPNCTVKETGFKVGISVAKCIDCGLVLGTEGSLAFDSRLESEVKSAAEFDTTFTLCERCSMKRSGFALAKSDRELGLE